MGDLAGKVALVTGFSRRLLHMLGLPLKSLDGKALIGDAFTEADLESEGC